MNILQAICIAIIRPSGATNTNPALIITETEKEFQAMTELHIDSNSPKFDRRKVLSGVAALPLVTVSLNAIAGNNDRAITEMVAEHARYSDWVDTPDCCTDDDLDAAMTAANNATATLHKTPADSLAGVREKVRWLRRPENFNDGYLEGCDVLTSIFEDIERLV